MQRHHPAPYERIPVSMEVYNKISLAILWDERHDATHWEIVAEAVDEWMRRHSPNAITLPKHLGYQWKQLFLPNGTILRTVFNGKNYHCRVENDQILYEGKQVSPSGFVNTVGGMRRNAWKSLWILRPESADWQRADSLRPRQRSVRRRKPSAAPEAPPIPSQARPAAAMESHGSQPEHGNSQAFAPPPSVATQAAPGVAGNWRRKPRPRMRPPHRGDSLAALLRHELLPFIRQMLGLPATDPGEGPGSSRPRSVIQNL